MGEAIFLKEVYKAYPGESGCARKHNVVLNDLSMTVPAGTVFGFLGCNGAGKSTAIKIMLGLVRPDRGTVRVLGRSPADRNSRKRIGFLPEAVSLIEELTARETIRYAGNLRGLKGAGLEKKTDSLLQKVGLEEHSERRVKGFSKGMKQRLGLASALIDDPELLVADEPQSGLDPEGVTMIKNVLLDLKKEGKTVFYSTHQLLVAGQICDRIAILDSGRIIHEQKTGEDANRLEEIFIANIKGVRE